MESAHILILPFPFQGHIMPLMEVAHKLIDAGFTVTFVNTDYNHRRLLSATADDGHAAFSTTTSSRLHLLGIPDGMASDEDRKDLGLCCKLISFGMTPGLMSVIRAAADEGRPVQRILADQNMAWALPSAIQMGVRAAVFWPASAAMIAIILNIPKMIEIGVINEDGLQMKNEVFRLTTGIPEVCLTQLPWNLAGNSADKSDIFSYIMTNNRATIDHADSIICNTFMDLEPEAISLLPSIIPIGPLFPIEHHPIGHLWLPTNSSIVLNWLDSHSPGSVLYIAFGSLAIFDEAQVDELAHGLELTGRPFLWAVRPGLTTMSPGQLFSSAYLSRVRDRSLLVGWAPQQQVLAHPSIGCFISHCGWNSTLEGVMNGTRFLCWPYFTDQFLNQSYICETWKTGLRMTPEKNGEGELEGSDVAFITRQHIKERVEKVMRDDEMRERALMWKEKAFKSVSIGGSSYENFKRIVNIMKTSL
ncbi:UDP-glycosyltransferase 83A1-like [Phalaenopsis equestris]|uniref:UDP-glycosyltransferase 83A1-like n=1 Tax=Phalaenopsis equestris TaxID=78828 RepID=UPI0009E36534|nr:UDP-glycosyltransferase 83A1-like [Phalaenopsis equestris]